MDNLLTLSSRDVRQDVLVSCEFVGTIVGIQCRNKLDLWMIPTNIPTMSLTDLQIKRLKPTDKVFRTSDGGGLFIETRSNGSKLWRLAYRYGGKQKLLSFGAYPETSLARARERRLEAKSLLADGKDPATQVRQAKREKAVSNALTFGSIAEEYLSKCEREGLAEATLTKKRWLLSLASKQFWQSPIESLTAATILADLRVVESKGNYESAKRMRAAIGQVFRYAIATARAKDDPTYALRGALIKPQTVHMPALTDWESFGALVRAIWAYDAGAPETRAALKLMTLLYPRPGELRLAKWNEFDLEARIWMIPAQRAKMRREHQKPLSKSAVSILHELKELNGATDWVFPSILSRGKSISENTMNTALRRMGFTKEECTSHGFRASASTLLNESGKWNRDAVEAELAHIGADEVRRAYHRATYWKERVRMCNWWDKKIIRLVKF